jgi:hypothetical protein
LPQTAPTPTPEISAALAPPKVDDGKLSALTQPKAPAPAVEKPAVKTEPAQPVDLSKADEKLSSLLGGKK